MIIHPECFLKHQALMRSFAFDEAPKPGKLSPDLFRSRLYTAIRGLCGFFS